MSDVNIEINFGSFVGALAILFIALKLLDKIDWSWWWVLSPLWIPIGIVLGIGIIILILGVIFTRW